MARFRRAVFHAAAIGSTLLLVVLGVFISVGNPTQGHAGILFLKTPWGVARFYAEEALHVSWLDRWPELNEPKWGVRCGQINLSDANTYAWLVGQQRSGWIGDIGYSSGQFVPVSHGAGTDLRWDMPILLTKPMVASATGGTISVRMLFVPWWEVFVTLAILPAVWMIRYEMKRLRKGPMREGLCAVCGYDLRATLGRCPECGAVPGKAGAV